MTAWSDRAAAELEIPWLLDAIAPAGEIGRRLAPGREQFGPGDETRAEHAMRSAVDAAASLRVERIDALRAAFAAMPDPAPALARAALGEVLDDVALFELARFCAAAIRLHELTADLAIHQLSIPEIEAGLAARLALGRSEGGGFYLTERFDDRLAPARAAAEAAETSFSAARDRIAASVAAAAGLDSIRSGEFILMRDRVGSALPANVRVVREAPAYLLCELILDSAAVERMELRDAARARVAALEEEVRAGLSATIRAHERSLLELRKRAGTADLFLGVVRFAQQHATCAPTVVERALVQAEEAVYLPLQARLPGSYTPITIDLEGAAIVTGPNMGGKSAALRTCGFLAACVVLGVPVPASRARIGVFDDIAWAGLGADGAAAGERALLSAFGREVVDLRDALSAASRRRLLLVDEFGRTTTTEEGAALLVGLLQFARDSGACAFAATHISGIAERAGAAHFAIAGARPLRFDGRTLELEDAIARIGEAMDFRLVRVTGDRAERGGAIVLAELLGLERAIVDRARAELEGA